MRIRRPVAEPNPHKPFQGALFGRDRFAASLTSLIRKSSEGMVIFVNAPWGAGKTTFSRMWQTHLRSQKIEVINFDAYTSDYVADPFVSFTGEILTLLDKHLDNDKGVEPLRRSFCDAAVNFAKGAAPILGKAAVRAATAGIVRGEDLEDLKDTFTSASGEAADVIGSSIRSRIENYEKEKSSLSSFRGKLAEVAKLVNEKQGFPLTIVVDELDRCRPSFALELLERIKHLFDVDGVVFVLLVNRVQIETYVRCVYGEDVDAPAYLQKFGDLFVDLPSGRIYRNDESLRSFFETLFAQFEVGALPITPFDLSEDMVVFGHHFQLTLREVEHVVKVIAIDRASLTNVDFDWHPLSFFFAFVRVKEPALFHDICEGSYGNDSMVDKLRLEELASSLTIHRHQEHVQIVIASILPRNPTRTYPEPVMKILRDLPVPPGGITMATEVCRRIRRFQFSGG